MKRETFASLSQDRQLKVLIESPVGVALGLTEKFAAQAIADQGRAKNHFKETGMATWRKESLAVKESRSFPFLYRWVMLERAFFAFHAATEAFGASPEAMETAFRDANGR